jgi:histidyl-tRNA synthetase
MTKVKVGIPQGTRDFEPEVVRKRNYIFDTIRNVFELYGFQPLETPAMENMETLMGKYGEEGDKLIFKILNNGIDNPEKEKQVREDFEKVLQGKNVKGITERALKYDLTIPFARYIAMNHGKLVFPFKRYQIQPVWRADRPQKSRYREFYQCDADVVGSNSLLNEIELANIYHEVFTQLGMTNYELRINHRKILAALAELCGDMEKIADITIAIDKLDKIGLEKVKEELQLKGLAKNKMAVIEKYLNISGSNEEKLTQVKKLLGDNETGKKGITEIEYMIGRSLSTHHPPLTIDFTLARGLNYYTGIIFEAKAPVQVTIGSIGGGGRYDDLTGLFGVPNIPGVGISFGVDRIYDVMEELNLFPADLKTGTKVMFLNMGEKESQTAFGWMQQLRHKGISCELYHEPAKIDKQFKYAEKKNILYVVTIGENEIKESNCKIKNIRTGDQQLLPMNDLFQFAF